MRRIAWRELKARHAGSALGVAWTVLEPAVQFALYLTVFGGILGMRLANSAGVGSFGFYLLSGLVPFMALQEMAVRAVTLAREQASLVRHVNVPLAVLLGGSLLATLLRNGISLALVLAASLVAGTLSWPGLPWLLCGVALLAVGGLGLGLLLTPVGAFVPDAAPVVSSAFTVLFFLTPIVYPETLLPEVVSRWVLLNPVVGLLETFRAALVGGEVVPHRTVVTAATALLLLVVGGLVFSRREAAVRDVV